MGTNKRRRPGSEGMAGTSRFAVTCELLRQYMRKHQGHQMVDLARLFQFPAPPLPPPEEKDDRTMQLFPLPVGASMSQSDEERPEVKMDRATMEIFCHVPQEEEQAQMRAESLHRFLKKRKVRMSEPNPDHNDDSTTPADKHKDTAAGMPFLDLMDVPDPSWLSL